MCLHKRVFSAMANNKKISSSAIQALYDLCAQTFTPSSPSPPSPTAIYKLSSLLATEDEDKSGIEKEEEYAWLAEIDTPDDLYMRTGTYTAS